MKTKSFVAALTVATSCGLVWAGTATSAAAESAAYAGEPNPTADASRRVCRRVQPTGSRLPERVCRSQREWDESAQKTRDGMDQSALHDSVGNLAEQERPNLSPRR